MLAASRHYPSSVWILLCFSGGTVLSAVLQRHLLEPAVTAQHLAELNVGEAFGLAALASLALSRGRERVTLTASDIAVLLASALAWFVPEQHGVYLSTTLASSWFLVKKRSDKRLVGIGQIWLALSIYELWGKLLFKILYQTIEIFEVGLIYKVGRLLFDGLDIAGASLSVKNDWSIVILEGCSSFHNLSLTVLIWLCILKMAKQSASPMAFGALGLSACGVITINVARILAMLPSREAYLFWHDGAGASLVALASVSAAILPVLIRTERSHVS